MNRFCVVCLAQKQSTVRFTAVLAVTEVYPHSALLCAGSTCVGICAMHKQKAVLAAAVLSQ